MKAELFPICREGCFSKHRVPVTDSVTFIPQRLKEIDPDYFVMFNTLTQRFEVHDSRQPFSTLACVLPFDGLDERAIRHVREHRVEHLADIVDGIERHNDRLERQAERDFLSRAADRTREALTYLSHTDKTDQLPPDLLKE